MPISLKFKKIKGNLIHSTAVINWKKNGVPRWHYDHIAKALNKKTHISVKFDDLRIKKNFFKIRIQDIENWPGVYSGYINKKEAERMFFSFFQFKNIK